MYVGRPFSATFPFQLGVTIGFSPTTYTVSEGVGSVSVAVSLQNGILARDVVVTLQTLDGTAMGEYLREVHFVFCKGQDLVCKANCYPMPLKTSMYVPSLQCSRLVDEHY